jgi:hypothetical protein
MKWPMDLCFSIFCGVIFFFPPEESDVLFLKCHLIWVFMLHIQLCLQRMKSNWRDGQAIYKEIGEGTKWHCGEEH